MSKFAFSHMSADRVGWVFSANLRLKDMCYYE